MGLFQDEASLLGVAVAVNEDSMPVMSLNTLPKLPSIPSSHAPPWRDRYGSTVTVASTPSMMSLYGDDGAGDLYAWPSLFEQVCGIGCVCCGCGIGCVCCGCGCAYTLRSVGLAACAVAVVAPIHSGGCSVRLDIHHSRTPLVNRFLHTPNLRTYTRLVNGYTNRFLHSTPTHDW